MSDTEEMVELSKEEYDHYQKLRHVFRSMHPDRFEGQIFICGASTTEDETGMPDRLHICRAYGSDYVKIYKRVD